MPGLDPEGRAKGARTVLSAGDVTAADDRLQLAWGFQGTNAPIEESAREEPAMGVRHLAAVRSAFSMKMTAHPKARRAAAHSG
jgi:hypothetical protein